MNAELKNSDWPDAPPRRLEVAAPESDNSPSLDKLAGALAKAQGSITGARKDSANPFFKSKYADLASCWDACRKPLSENGLAVIQIPEVGIEFITIMTLLVHESGQWIRSRLPMKPKDFSPQSVGSTITYGRRYALAAMVGLAQTDDDAEAAQQREPEPDTTKVREYAKRFQEALDVSEQSVLDIHHEMNEDQEFYRAVWGQIPSGARRQLKEVIDRSKKEAAKASSTAAHANGVAGY
jgi:hypothetical protein